MNPIRRDYPIEEFRADTDGCNIVKSVYVQTNWPAGQSYDEAKWVQSVSDDTGWPHANVAHADLADPACGALIERLSRLPAMRGIRQQIHWHPNPQYRFAPHPEVMNDPRLAPRPSGIWRNTSCCSRSSCSPAR